MIPFRDRAHVITAVRDFYVNGGEPGIVKHECRYSTPTGGRCAVGVLLHLVGANPDDGRYEGKAVGYLIDNVPALHAALVNIPDMWELLHMMQGRHDDAALEEAGSPRKNVIKAMEELL